MVMVPPRIAQKPIGISMRDCAMLVRTETRETTGRNRAVAPMFWIIPEIPPTVPEISGTILRTLPLPTRNTLASTASPAHFKIVTGCMPKPESDVSHVVAV